MWVYRRMFPDSIWYRPGLVWVEEFDVHLHAHPPAIVTLPEATGRQ